MSSFSSSILLITFRFYFNLIFLQYSLSGMYFLQDQWENLSDFFSEFIDKFISVDHLHSFQDSNLHLSQVGIPGVNIYLFASHPVFLHETAGCDHQGCRALISSVCG